MGKNRCFVWCLVFLTHGVELLICAMSDARFLCSEARSMHGRLAARWCSLRRRSSQSISFVFSHSPRTRPAAAWPRPMVVWRFIPQTGVYSRFLSGWIPSPEKNLQSPKTAANLCALSLFWRQWIANLSWKLGFNGQWTQEIIRH